MPAAPNASSASAVHTACRAVVSLSRQASRAEGREEGTDAGGVRIINRRGGVVVRWLAARPDRRSAWPFAHLAGK